MKLPTFYRLLRVTLPKGAEHGIQLWIYKLYKTNNYQNHNFQLPAGLFQKIFGEERHRFSTPTGDQPLMESVCAL